MTRIVTVPFLLAWPPERYAAQVLLPGVVFVRRGYERDVELIAHELVHVDQLSRYGLVGYWARYAWLLARHGYGAHPFEVEAHEREGEFTRAAERLIAKQDGGR